MVDKVRLYDPHPGFLGAAVPLPESMKEAIDQLAEKEMSLEETLELLNPITEKIGGKIAVYDYVILFRTGPHI